MATPVRLLDAAEHIVIKHRSQYTHVPLNLSSLWDLDLGPPFLWVFAVVPARNMLNGDKVVEVKVARELRPHLSVQYIS